MTADIRVVVEVIVVLLPEVEIVQKLTYNTLEHMLDGMSDALVVGGCSKWVDMQDNMPLDSSLDKAAVLYLELSKWKEELQISQRGQQVEGRNC